MAIHGARGIRVERAYATCERRGARCPNTEAGVDDGHKIKGKHRNRAGLGERGGDTEEGVEAGETKTVPHVQKTKGSLMLARDYIGNDERNECDKSDNASGPAEANPRL